MFFLNQFCSLAFFCSIWNFFAHDLTSRTTRTRITTRARITTKHLLGPLSRVCSQKDKSLCCSCFSKKNTYFYKVNHHFRCAFRYKKCYWYRKLIRRIGHCHASIASGTANKSFETLFLCYLAC